MKQFKRILAVVLTVCLITGLLLPFSTVQAASDSVDYNMQAAGTTANIEEDSFISTTEWQYKLGLQNWYILDHYNNRSNGTTLINRNYGMRVTGNVESWIALVIKAPGTGSYTMQLTGSESTYGAELALAYIMPMSDAVTTDTINDTIQNGAALGCADFYSANASGYNNVTANLGSYTFTAGEEYVFVLYASEGYVTTGGAAYMFFSKITAVKGSVSSSQETEINAVDLGPMITEFGLRGPLALREVNGYDYYFLPIKGGIMQIYNLDYYCDGDSTTDPYVGAVNTDINCAWGCSAGEDGMIYVTGDAQYVYRYDPDTGIGEKLTFAQSYVCGYDVGADAAGNIYFGLTKGNAGVAYYENATGTFHIYDGLDATGVANDCSAIAWDSEYIYAYLRGVVGNNSTQVIVQVDKTTGEVVRQMDVSAKVGSTGHLTGMNIVDGVLFAGSNYITNMIAIDIEAWSFIDIGVSGGIRGNVSEERNGKVYFICSDKAVYSYDIANREASKLNITTSQSLHTNLNSFVTLDVDNDGVDEDVVFTCRSAVDGYPLLYDVYGQKLYSWTDMMNTDAGAYMNLRGFHPSNDGSNTIFVGAYITNNCIAYNTKTEDYVNYLTAGQTDSQIMYKGVLYAGNYSSCTLAKINYKEGTYEALYTLSPEGQKRIHCLAAGEDKIFFSTIPDSYDLGGYLAWHDLNTGENYSVQVSSLNEALADQVVVSMAYTNGYLYCGTTVRGGNKSTPTKINAHLFVFDVASKQVVAVQEVAYPYVASLDADSSGTVWGVISKTLFTVSYQNNTITFTEKFNQESGTLLTDAQRKAESTSVNAWLCKTIYFRGDNLYVVLGDTGLWEISKSGSGSLISAKITGRYYALSEDGNIYYGNESNLMLLPLNISDSDKTAAAAVNSALESILKMSPAGTGSALTSVKEAYGKLTNVQKSLVDLAALNAAERRYAIAVIDTLPEIVTVDAAGAIAEARTAYDALPSSQQSRVTNYQRLVEAENELSIVVDVDAVENLIQSLNKEIYLETEAEIENVRAAYDGLTDAQKTRISIETLAILSWAEASLESLKREKEDAEAVLVMDLHTEAQTLAAGGSVDVAITGAANDKYTLSISFATTAAWTCEVLLDGTLVGTLNISEDNSSFELGVTLNGNHTLTLKNASDAAVEFGAETLSLTAYIDAASALGMTSEDVRVITLQHDAVTPEFTLQNGDVLNLNGNVLIVGGSGVIVLNGQIIDSSTCYADSETLGGIKGNVYASGESSYMPLQDGDICRFYYYEAEVFDNETNPYQSGNHLLFWFGIEFNHISAYELIETGASGIDVYAQLSWTTKDGGGSKIVEFDEVLTRWAGGAVEENYSMYVAVTGAELLEKGDVITVVPMFESAGVRAQIGESMTYVATGRVTMVAFHGVFGADPEDLFFEEGEDPTSTGGVGSK